MKQGLDNRSMNMAQGANGTSAQNDPMKPQGLSRRNFVAAAAMGLAGVAAAGLAGCSPKSSGEPSSSSSAGGAAVPSSWDGEYDVIVCGGGGSGLTAAYSALENGASSVVVLEKAVQLAAPPPLPKAPFRRPEPSGRKTSPALTTIPRNCTRTSG